VGIDRIRAFHVPLRGPVRRVAVGGDLHPLTGGDGPILLVRRAYEVAFEVLEIAGAGRCLTGGAHHHEVVHSTDPAGQEAGNLQVHPALQSAQHRGGLDDPW